jgi:anti-sigma28 factor (negative regulator of flagellin synthesis)
MKIDPQQIAGLSSAATTSPVTPSPTKSTYSSAVDASSDHAEISGLSRAIQAFQGERAGRISQVAASVRDGTYSVNPALISRGIVNEALGGGKLSATSRS